MRNTRSHPLARYRRRAGLSLKQLAGLVPGGTSPAALCRIEQGHDPTLDLIRRLRAAGCTVTATQFLNAGASSGAPA